MSSLNLIPNPGLLAVQAGIFLANLVVVRKFMIDPYLSLKSKRELLTTGSHSEAEEMLRDCREKNADLSEKIAKVRDEMGARRVSRRQAAEADAQQVFADAKKEAAEYISAVRSELKENLRQEYEKVPALVESLTQEVYRATLR